MITAYLLPKLVLLTKITSIWWKIAYSLNSNLEAFNFYLDLRIVSSILIQIMIRHLQNLRVPLVLKKIAISYY